VPDEPFEDDFKEESTRLAESLKYCRSVVNDYRAMLTGDHSLSSPDESGTADSGE